MAKGYTKRVKQEIKENVANDIQEELKGVKLRVLHPVLGYKVGDTFTAEFDAVKRQIKHGSLEII